MLTHEEHEAMIMFDRLLMSARENETVADLLDQTLNVARMIDPRPNDQVVYGPLQRMHFEWQQLKHRMYDIEKRMDQYINNQNRYGGTYVAPTTGGTSHWPSNPGLGSTAYPLGSSLGGWQDGYGATPPMTWDSNLNSTATDQINATTTDQIKNLLDQVNKYRSNEK